MPITLRQLRYFAALAEQRNFGRAALACHVSQPALSVQIRALEDTLGAALVERLPKDIVLTRAGREVLARAGAILRGASDLEGAAENGFGQSAPLHLGLIPTVAPYLLPEALADLRSADITQTIRVREAQTSVLLGELAEGLLDAAVVALPAPGFREIPLAEDGFVLAGSERSFHAQIAGAEALRPTELDPSRLMLLDEGHCLADQALDVCGLSRRPRVHLGASSLATLAGLAAQGFGLTFLPEIALRTEVAAAPDLRLARFAAPEPSRRLGLVLRREAAVEPWVESLTETLHAGAQRLIRRARSLCPGGPDALPGF
jgi:LysR family hydrogen peroxide-inducible transcriptional activator